MTAIVDMQSVIDAMAEAVVNATWGEFRGEMVEGGREADWRAAREGHLHATKDDMVEALGALERLGLLAIDPDGETVSNGSSCTSDPCTCANGIGCVNIPVDQW